MLTELALGGSTGNTEGVTTPPAQPSPDAQIQRLERWLTHGGTWRLLDDRGWQVGVALCRCDGGEVVDRFTTDDPETIRWLRLQSSQR